MNEEGGRVEVEVERETEGGVVVVSEEEVEVEEVYYIGVKVVEHSGYLEHKLVRPGRQRRPVNVNRHEPDHIHDGDSIHIELRIKDIYSKRLRPTTVDRHHFREVLLLGRGFRFLLVYCH